MASYHVEMLREQSTQVGKLCVDMTVTKTKNPTDSNILFSVQVYAFCVSLPL
jgi:hypothetical protein